MKPKRHVSVPSPTVTFTKGTLEALTDLLNGTREAQMLVHGVYHERSLHGAYRIRLLGAVFEPVSDLNATSGTEP